MPEITVVGSGVLGMSSAVCLQQAGFDVTIITRDMPKFTTSMAAGAVWYGGGAVGKSREWAEITLEHFQKLATVENSGLHITRLKEVFPHPAETPWFKDLLPYFELIPRDELPANSQSGFVMDVPIVQSPQYLQYLVNQFETNGGTFEINEIKMLDELKYDHALVVNCTGVWARQVADDPSVFPIRGQTIIVDAPDVKQGYMNDQSFTYLFPRNDGVLIGGVAQPNNWNVEIDSNLTIDIVARCSQIEPSVVDAPILHQFVGLRPGRNQVRLETEKLNDSCTVIHNYGHAGVGYTLSWGCAQDVTSLAQGLLSN